MTKEALKDIFYREATIAVISPYSHIRIPILKSLKHHGFNKITVYKSIDEFRRNEKHNARWIITHLFPDAPLNSLSYMKSYYDLSEHHTARFSLILNREEEQAIPEAFDLGCLSWYSQETIEETKEFDTPLEDTLDRIKGILEHKQNEAYLAASYLRAYLIEEKIWPELIQLEKSLCKLFPRDGLNFIRLADAYFVSGDYKQGRVTYDQIQQMHAVALESELESLRKRYPKALLSSDKYASKYNIDQVIVIESDQAELATLRQGLEKLGISSPKEFDSYKSAWDYLKSNQEPDLLICEWTKRKIDIEGGQFLQRLRSHGFINVPVVILASHLAPNDSQLINDMHCIQIISKPLREHDLLMSLAYAIQQFRAPTERKTAEYKIEQALKSNNLAYASFLRNRFIKDKNVAAPRKYYVEALFQFHNNHLEKARNLLIKGIKLNADASHAKDIKPNIDKTILLAKCLFRLGDKQLAIQMMERARERSPYNIGILVDLVQMNYEAGNIDQASQTMEKAEAIDAGNSQVIDASAMMALYTGEIQKAQKLLKTTENLTDIISSMNNEAVSLIKRGDFDKGIELYKSAIKSLAEDHVDIRGVVYYNLALAYLRKDMSEPGILYLKNASGCDGSRVQRKAESLLQRCQRAIEQKRQVSLLVSKQDDSISSDLSSIIKILDEDHEFVGLRKIYVRTHRSMYAMSLLRNQSHARKSAAPNPKAG